MVILLGINESEGGRSALTQQNAATRLFRQRTGQRVPVGQTSEALLQEPGEFADVQGFSFFSQYLNGQVNKRLTSSSMPACKGRFGFRLSLKLPDSAQLVIELKFKDLK